MKTYRIIFVLLLALFIFYNSSGQICNPHPDGYYMYYANLNLDTVPNDFSKTDFMNLLNLSDSLSENELSFLDSSILNVKKSFPTAVTNFLQHSISINANFNELDTLLQGKSNQINLVEKKCMPIPLLETNDYHAVSSWIGGDTYHDLIRTNEAWDINTGDERILIGCTDSYLNENHEDISNKIEHLVHNVYQSNSSGEWHGTPVVSCLVAETDNNKGVASVSYKSKLVFSDNHGDILQIAQTSGVRVMNFSWGHLYHSVTEENFYNTLKDVYNVVVVSGAGNGPCWEVQFCQQNTCLPCNTSIPCNGGFIGDGTCKIYPASYESVISTTSIGHTFEHGTTYTAPDSTYWGKFLWKDCHQWQIGNDSTHQHHELVNISATGYNAYTTDWGYTIDSTNGSILNISNSKYVEAWGTSFAAPIVASACALVAATNPCLTAAEIQEIVLHTADPSIYLIPENQDYIGKLGTGRLDVYEAVKRALDLETIYIQNQTYNGVTATESSLTALYAGYNVTTSQPYGLVRILPNSNITFEATNSIILSEGFEVKNNAFFEAAIVESPCIE